MDKAIVLSIMLCACACACACAVAPEEAPGVERSSGEERADSSTYFWVVRDGQPCTAAGCRYVIARVNRVVTWCADRRPRLACSVNELDTSAIELSRPQRGALDTWLATPRAVLVRGWFEATPDGAWSRLVAAELWVAGADNGTSLGLAVKVTLRDVACPQTPCEDKEELVLDVGARHPLAILRLRPASISTDEARLARASLADDLIAIGGRYFVWQNHEIVRARAVTQFYTRWPPPPGAPLGTSACEAMGGIVRGDVGDGEIQCEPDETFVGRVIVGIEGGVCCLP